MNDQSLNELLEQVQDAPAAIESQAVTRFASSDSYQSQLIEKYQVLHGYYYPENGDQWPEDRAKRPGKIHMTANIIKPAIDVDARLQSVPPRVTIPTSTLAGAERKRAEAAEALHIQWLEASDWENWLFVLCQTRSLYGKGILKPFWNDRLKQPDVRVIENPANLRLGWSVSDYSKIDWAIYEYAISPQEAMLRYDVSIEQIRGGAPRVSIDRIAESANHADPLQQRNEDYWNPRYRELSDYEKSQVKVWDYWWLDKAGTPQNAIMVNGHIVDGPNAHDYLADIPYIVIENDHEPGSPEGISTAEPLLDVQYEFNRLLSHAMQHVADETDPAWYMRGPSADSVPPGLIPTSGKIIGAGENTIDLIPKGANVFPFAEMIGELWNEYHRLSGLPEILFGQTPGADTSGRAIAVQVEAAANRLDPRRRRLYTGLRELLIFWTIMAERKNPIIQVVPADEETGQPEKRVGLKELVGDFRRFKIIAPEITPRDNAEVTMNEINKVNAKLSSLRTAMDAIGIEAPEQELEIIAQEQTNVDLNAAAVQAKVSIYPILQQMQQTQMELTQMMAAQGQQAPGSILDPATQAATAANGAMQAQQGSQPRSFEDMNQPPTGAGSPPPQGAGVPGGPSGSVTSLVRQGEPLSQVRVDQPF